MKKKRYYLLFFLPLIPLARPTISPKNNMNKITANIIWNISLPIKAVATFPNHVTKFVITVPTFVNNVCIAVCSILEVPPFLSKIK